MLKPHQIFVFGSNLSGYHGRGAAATARKFFGAVMGQGVGHYGDSYALPTKTADIRHTLPLHVIRYYVDQFVEYARTNPGLEFIVTRVGCGLAGLKDEQMAPLFVNAGENCQFDTAWKPWLPNKKFWGTF